MKMTIFRFVRDKKYGSIYATRSSCGNTSVHAGENGGCGKMILGSDSHTRYGALGTLAMGEGGGELVKQLLGKTYDLAYPKVCLTISYRYS